MPKLSVKAVCADPVGKDNSSAPNAFEWALCAREGCVKGFTIEHLANPQNQGGHQPKFKTWATLSEEPPAHATEILFRSGHGMNAMDGTRYIVYTGRNNPALNNTGDTLRIVDSNSAEQGRYEIAANRCDVLPAAPKTSGIVSSLPRPCHPAAAAFSEVR